MVLHMAWRTNTGGEKKTITRVCLWSTWAHHSDCPRDKTSFINVMWKRHEFISPWGKKLQFWFQSFRVKSSLCPLWRKWRPAFQPLPSPPSFPWIMLQTHFPHSPRWLPVWEGIAGGKEGRPWPLRKAHALCISLLPSSPQPISLSPVSPASISSPHWAPAPKLSSLAPCPQTKKHPQTHPWAKKHLPGSLRDANGWVPSLEGDLWKGPGPILQDGGVLSAEGAATSVSPRHLNHRPGRLDRHSWSLSES